MKFLIISFLLFPFSYINAFDKVYLEKYFDNLTGLKLPYVMVDNFYKPLENEQPLSQEQIKELSINMVKQYDNVSDEEKEISIIYKLGFKNNFYALWARVYPRGMKYSNAESVLIFYDENYRYIGDLAFAGNCSAQCECYIYSIVYDNYIKNITFAPCPPEDDAEDSNFVPPGFLEKYRINEAGRVQRIHAEYISEEEFIYQATIINTTDKKKGIINDGDGFTNIRNSPNTNAKIIGKILDGEMFYYWENMTENWWLIETQNGMIGGYMHKSRIKEVN